jgi:hypothetical protein
MLGVLANATIPYSGYRIAKVARVQLIKASAELRRFKEAGIVRELPGNRRGSMWTLTDPNLRAFFRQRVRIFSWEDLRSQSRDRERRGRKILAEFPTWDFSKYTPNPSVVSHPEDFIRRPGKDAELAGLGLKTRNDVRKRRLK